MTWTGVDNFDSYTSGNALGGLNGGTGWANAWTPDANNDADITDTQSQSSPNSVLLASGGSEDNVYRRQLSSDSATDGDQVTFAMRRANTTTFNQNVFATDSGGATRWAIRLTSAGAIQAQFASPTTLQASYNADQWYVFVVEFDYTNSRFRVSIDGGAFSAYIAFAGAAGSNTRTIILNINTNANANCYWDSIGVPAAPASSTRDARLLTVLGVG